VANADITATYSTPDGSRTLKIEVASNGNLRSETSPGTRVIFVRAGTCFVVDRNFTPAMVSSIDDLASATFEFMAKFAPAALERAKHVPHRVFVLKGTATVQGRSGDSYYEQAPDGTLSPTPWVVISHDPAIAPLGKAMASQFEQGERLSPSPPNQATRDILRSGTPVFINGMELRSLSDAAIDPSEFELPSPPETPDALRKRLAQLQ
jgi:hypothetical protein